MFGDALHFYIIITLGLLNYFVLLNRVIRLPIKLTNNVISVCIKIDGHMSRLFWRRDGCSKLVSLMRIDEVNFMKKMLLLAGMLVASVIYAGCEIPAPQDAASSDTKGNAPGGADTKPIVEVVKAAKPAPVTVGKDVDTEPEALLKNASFDRVSNANANLPAMWEAQYKGLQTTITKYALVDGRDAKGKAVALQGPWCHLWQYIRGNQLKPLLGKRIEVSLWGKVSGAKPGAFMRVGYYGPKKEFKSFNIGNWSKINDKWSEFKYTMDVPTTATAILIDIANKSSHEGSLVFFDDVRLEEVKSLKNGSFDVPSAKKADIPENWRAIYEGSWTSTTKYALVEGREGKGKAVQLQGPWCHLYQEISGNNLKPFLGNQARITLWCKRTDPKAGVFMRIGYMGVERKLKSFNIGNWPKVNDKWGKFACTIDVPTTATMMNIDLANKSALEGAYVLFDDVTLEVVKPAAKAAAKPAAAKPAPATKPAAPATTATAAKPAESK